MNDHSLDMTPRAEFADRLEADLLRVIGDRDADTSNPQVDEEPLVNVELTPTPPSTRTRWMIFAAAAAVIALVALGIAFTGRGHTKSIKPADSVDETTSSQPANSHDVTFTVTWSMGPLAKQDCVNSGYFGCLEHFQMPGVSKFQGDVTGQAAEGVFWNARVPYASATAQSVSHEEFVAVYGVYATVPECGVNRNAEFMLTETIQDTWSTDTFTERGTYIGTWQIVPESGRGALANVSGSGTSSGEITYADETKNARTFTGTITCP